MANKNLNLKKALKPVSEAELQSASGGILNRYGCCSRSRLVGVDEVEFGKLKKMVGQFCTTEACPPV